MSSRTALTAIIAATLLVAGCTVTVGPQARHQGYGPQRAPSYSAPPQQRPVEIIRQSGNGWSLTFNTGTGQCDWVTQPGGTVERGRQAEREADQACTALGAQHGFRY